VRGWCPSPRQRRPSGSKSTYKGNYIYLPPNTLAALEPRFSRIQNLSFSKIWFKRKHIICKNKKMSEREITFFLLNIIAPLAPSPPTLLAIANSLSCNLSWLPFQLQAMVTVKKRIYSKLFPFERNRNKNRLIQRQIRIFRFYFRERNNLFLCYLNGKGYQ